MATFDLSRAEMGDPDRLHRAIRKATQNYDFDSGWVKLPTDRLVKFNVPMQVLPRHVRVLVSDNANGNAFSNGDFSKCSMTDLTVSGLAAYARVLVNR